MDNFDPFVIPFTGGVIVLVAILLYKYVRWLIRLPSEDKKILRKGVFTVRFLTFFREVILESLIHRRIWRVHPLLGYMHMSFALGWFLLIVAGALESRIQHGFAPEPFWQAIFYRFFQRDMEGLPYAGFFNSLMDFLLLYILSGLVLAMIKRFYSHWFGMKKAARQSLPDQLALITLWLIFPLRLLAESLTSASYHNGGFLTGTIGDMLTGVIPLRNLTYTSWWAYSIALGTFFAVLPFSRYMHIPTEVLLIALRKAGLKTGKDFTSFSWIEVNSCPRCGICVDKCQLAMEAGIRTAPPIYLTRAIRNRNINPDKAFNCLVCGRCTEYCPVQIDVSALRITQRKKFNWNNNRNYDYLQPFPVRKADVAFFAGCMSHLTPTIIRAMKDIFNKAGVNYSFIDEHGSICCGRPLLLSGAEDSARQLIETNKILIRDSGAGILVTSCPICYKEFKEKYDLGIEVLHHSAYLLRLIRQGRISPAESRLATVFHDPCELGRGSGIYEQPREVLEAFTELMPVAQEKQDGLCCGGSLGNIMLSAEQKDRISSATVEMLATGGPDIIVTACPLCKKTLSRGNDYQVKDIAELVSAALNGKQKN
jgi:Fe-S oxidoreductase